jgi:hypothetical protein
VLSASVVKDSAMKNPFNLRTAAVAALIASFGAGFTATAFAHSDGVDGASGKNNGFYCRNCHAGGAVPTVVFEGPTAMDLGSTATFRFTVTSQSASQIVAGIDVAASDGTLGLVLGQGTHLQRQEVTHSLPKANDANGRAIFEFTWQAPARAGTYVLFGAGTSANDDSLRTGDAAARTTYEIFVGVATPTPTSEPPTPTPTATSTPNGLPNACAGDCGSDGEVTVEELITGVSIALGVSPVSVCSVFDMNRDGEVTIDEILLAVNNALDGCTCCPLSESDKTV